MSEYIVNIPADYNRDGVYYPDERHEPMAVREKVTRCRDCAKWATERRYTGMCCGPNGNIDPDGFCAWPEPKEGGES